MPPWLFQVACEHLYGSKKGEAVAGLSFSKSPQKRMPHLDQKRALSVRAFQVS